MEGGEGNGGVGGGGGGEQTPRLQSFQNSPVVNHRDL